MRIAVDIDDTLNVIDRVGRAGAYIERKHLPFRLKNEYSNKFVEVYDWKIENVLEFIRDGGIVAFTDAAARKGAREALTRLREAGHEIVILTSRMEEWFVNPEQVSRDWLEKRRIPYDEIAAGIPMEEKGKYCIEHGISVMIDDDITACLAAQNAGVRAVLAVGRHNIDRAREIKFGGANWKQIEAIVNRIAMLLKK